MKSIPVPTVEDAIKHRYGAARGTTGVFVLRIGRFAPAQAARYGSPQVRRPPGDPA